MKTENEFIPFEQALALKELGFDEPCLGYYTSTGYFNSKKELKWRKWQFSYNFQPITNKQLTWKDSKTENVQQVVASLYQQAFRWFRINKKLEYHIKSDMMGYHIYIVDRNINRTKFTGNNIFQTYEEAEVACLNKLIELCEKI